MRYFVATATLMGTVTRSVTRDSLKTPGGQSQNWFTIQSRSGDKYHVFISTETNFQVLSNLDGLNRDRVPTPAHVGEPNDPNPPKFDWGKLPHRIFKYVAGPGRNDAGQEMPGSLIVVRGIYQRHDERPDAPPEPGDEVRPLGVPQSRHTRVDARTVYLLDSKAGNYLFEVDHWWLTQLERLANGWLDVMFDDRRDYAEADFAELYRTRLNILGLPTDDDTQEMATLSRLIYGLSSAYLLTGEERYRKAASAGARYQRETFRCLDGQTGERCVWASAKRKSEHDKVAKLLFPSQNPDDVNQIPLYEQIYALAGLTQYYRISNDPEVFTDIIRTVKAFDEYWRDRENGGYYTHIDFETFTASSEALSRIDGKDNRLKKNWNSIGDHIPAYLINLLLAIDPVPVSRRNDTGMEELRQTCRRILAETTTLIRKQFPGNRPEIPVDEQSAFVNERFIGNSPNPEGYWPPDHGWGWQQNRGIVGHNLKIAWNLTRAANYFLSIKNSGQAAWLMQLAEQLGDSMAEKGLDQHRGGCFDAVERVPGNGMPYDFAWLPTKDFWQQEQGILAYLILFGYTGEPRYLQFAREMEAFWNLFFLDRDRWGIFFRVREDGSPVVEGTYGDKGGHAIAGYHSFELNFLAHIYSRVFLPQYQRGPNPVSVPGRFCLFFRPAPDLFLIDGSTTFNVLPDFFPPGLVALERVQIGGVAREPSDEEKGGFFVRLSHDDLGRELAVVFRSHAHDREIAKVVSQSHLEIASPLQKKVAADQFPTDRMRVNVPDWQKPPVGSQTAIR